MFEQRSKYGIEDWKQISAEQAKRLVSAVHAGKANIILADMKSSPYRVIIVKMLQIRFVPDESEK